MGRTRLGNEEVLDAAAAQPGRADPVRVSVDPHKGKLGVREARELDRARRARLQVPPQHAGVLAQRPRVLPALRGDRRGRADRAVPLRHDRDRRRHAGRRRRAAEVLQPDVASTTSPPTSPSSNIILAHPSFPWQDEALAIAMHKPNVYIDLSGWSPKYFPENLVRYTNTQLKHKMLFGSDYPLITPTAGWPTSRSCRSATRCGRWCSRRTRRGCSGYERSRLAAATGGGAARRRDRGDRRRAPRELRGAGRGA